MMMSIISNSHPVIIAAPSIVPNGMMFVRTISASVYLVSLVSRTERGTDVYGANPIKSRTMDQAHRQGKSCLQKVESAVDERAKKNYDMLNKSVFMVQMNTP